VNEDQLTSENADLRRLLAERDQKIVRLQWAIVYLWADGTDMSPEGLKRHMDEAEPFAGNVPPDAKDYYQLLINTLK